MISKKIVCFLRVILVLTPFYAVAQTDQSIIPKVFHEAPNSASLNKYGDFPVNLSTGLPDISIPIYEIQSGGLKVPIVLNYHASGIKVTDLASWAGLGWSISASGSITKRVQGKPDESQNGYLHQPLRDFATINPCTSNDDITYLINNANGLYDALPDIFSYDFPGQGGKFFLNGKNSYLPTLIPYAPLKIKRNANSTDPGSIASFNITDEKGNMYDFGTNGSIESTNSYSGGVSTYSLSSWMLESIKSQDRRDTINFTYTSSPLTTPPETSESITVDDDIQNINPPSPPPYTSTSINSNPVPYAASTISEQMINTINFKNGKVLFHQSDADRQDLLTSSGVKSLKDIQVYFYDYKTKAYVLLKTVKFFQSYFIKDSDADTRRLRLDSIQILDKVGAVVQRYKFEYSAMALPKYTTYGKDFWGYYNGKDGQSSLVPKTDIQMFNSNIYTTATIGSNVANGRDPDSLYMQAGMLNKIYYPTGGYSSFEYQTNRYIDTDGSVKLAGGLRIAAIKSFDGKSGIPLVKSYQYYNPVKNFLLENYFFYTSQTHKFWDSNIANGSALAQTKRTRVFLSSPTNDLLPWDGSPVTYTQVVEFEGNGIANNGKTVYKFSSSSDLNAARATHKPLLSSFFFKRGLLLSKSVYKHRQDGGYQILTKEVNNYTAFPLTWYNNVGIQSFKSVVNDPSGGFTSYGTDAPAGKSDDCHYWDYVSYSIPSDDNYLTSKTDYLYDPSDSTRFQTDSKTYSYNNITHQQVSKVYSQDSRGNNLITVSKYPADYLIGNTTGNAVLDSMISRNIQAELIERWDTVKNSAGVGLIKSAMYNGFKAGNSLAIVPSTKGTLDIVAPVTDFQPAHVVSGQVSTDGRYRQLVTFDSYDIKNNLVKYTPDKSPPVSILWEYSFDLPIAEIKNGYGQFAYTSFEANAKGNWVYGGQPVLDAAAPTGYKAYNLSQGNITFPSLNNTRPCVISYWSKTGSATINGVSGTKITKNTDGWTLYKHTIPAATASVTISGSVIIDELRMCSDLSKFKTYTYDPLMGITSITDEKGLITRYEYDNAARLYNIKNYQRSIIKNFSYNYFFKTTFPPEVFYSSTVTGTFQRTTCAADQIGGNATYSEPYGKFTSIISQDDANQQAQAALAIDGPNNANANGACMPLFYNTAVSNVYAKNNCGVGYAGSSVTYTVPAGTYSSAVSQADADLQAQNDISQKGQTYANAHGTCPDGTDIANWHISSNIPSSTGHTINVTITRPAGDASNVNTAYFHIPSKSYSGSIVMPAGSTSNTKTVTLSSAVGSSVSIILDSIN